MKNLIPKNDQPNNSYYNLRIKLKLTDTTSSHIPVLKVRAVMGTDTLDTIIYSDSLTQQYQEILAFRFYKYPDSISFNGPAQSNSEAMTLPLLTGNAVADEEGAAMDFLVYWMGQLPVYVDYIALDDDKAYRTMTGQNDNLINAEVNRFKNYDALSRFVVQEEPPASRLKVVGYIEQKIMQNVEANYPTN